MIINLKLLSIFLISFTYSSILPCFGETKSHILSVEKYLNSIHTLKAAFIQISSSGEVETGKVFIKKPGQMRFEYDSPSDHIVMASGLLLVIIDKKSSSEPQRYLTSQTPIGYLLKGQVDLANNSSLEAIFIQEKKIHITLADMENPQIGKLELVFSQQPISLKEWTITNYSGERTRIILEEKFINGNLNKKLFNIGQEISNTRKNLRAQ